MVSAIVSALTEFDSISEVQLLVEGEEVDALPFGTNISAPLTREDLNVESVSADTDLTGSGTVQVFFESEASGCIVPVTRTVFSNEDIDTAVLELLKGPREDSARRLHPQGRGPHLRKAAGRRGHHQHDGGV